MKIDQKILDFLQYSDGKNDLSEISKIIKVSKGLQDIWNIEERKFNIINNFN